MKLLSTRELSVGYRHKSGDRLLQSGINVDIEPGTIIALMGQNGVGKTTFIKTLLGMMPPLAGDLFIGEKNIRQLSAVELAGKVSVVLTERPFSGQLSVMELVSLGRYPYSNWLGTLSQHDMDRIEWAIHETHIDYLIGKKLAELSDGQFQKAMIARALVQDTDLIILDEPVAHLDLHNKIDVMRLLQKIARSGKSVLISTHDLSLSAQLSDRLWLFHFNAPMTEGIPEDLVLDGSLEKSLFLDGTGYDFIHGTIPYPGSRGGVCVTGERAASYWTVAALQRNGFSIDDTSAIRIQAAEMGWEITMGNLKRLARNIEEVITILMAETKRS